MYKNGDLFVANRFVIRRGEVYSSPPDRIRHPITGRKAKVLGELKRISFRDDYSRELTSREGTHERNRQSKPTGRTMKYVTITALAIVAFAATMPLAAQDDDVAVIAIFPFKNLYGEVQYDDLGWEYADSLEAYLNRQAGAGTRYEVVSNIDVRDQLLAQNVDVKSPSYETDVWTIAEALDADKLVWGTYFVKYDKVFLKTEVIDLSINMPDPENVGESKGLLYGEAIQSVPDVGDKILPALPW